jgi:hypothetical protein
VRVSEAADSLLDWLRRQRTLTIAGDPLDRAQHALDVAREQILRGQKEVG